MIRISTVAALLALGVATTASPALAQTEAARLSAQMAGMPIARPGVTDALSALDGLWIGPAWMMTPDGSRISFEQMERVGPMLDGEIRVMEGKARGPDGAVLFNAFTVFSAKADGGLEMRSHIPGNASTRTLEITAEGFVWRMAQGPGEIVYTAVIRDGVWRETGVFVGPGAAPVQFFEMTLHRRGDTDWPGANPDFH